MTSVVNTTPQHHAAMSVSEQQLRLIAELTTVAYAHAPAFVDAAQSVAAAEDATNRCRDASASLQTQLASFRVATQRLQESGAVWRKQRELAASAQAATSRLTELQEAPSTVDQAVRGGHYHEALTAVQHVRALQRRHPESATLARVVDEVDETLERLLTTTVLSQLSGPLVPSNALKIIMFLQSLANQQLQQQQQQHGTTVSQDGGFGSSSSTTAACSISAIATDPAALPELFLDLRSDYISGSMREAAALSGGSSFSCLQKVLAIYKLHVSEAVATFKSCFIDSEEQSSSAAILDARKALLCRWSTLHANKLVSLFATHTAALSSGADIAMLIDPVVQCGTALGKSGLDVSVVLEGLLMRRAEELFLHCMAQAMSSFSAALSAHRWRSVVELHSGSNSSSAKKNKKDAAAASVEEGGKSANSERGKHGDGGDEDKDDDGSDAGKEAAAEAEKQKQQDGFVPPMSLLRFPPLAHAMNSFLAGCNELRKCALHGLRPVCLRAIAQLVDGVAQHLAGIRGTLLLEGPELESLRVMARAFEEDFVSHVERCTLRVFGSQDGPVDVSWKQQLEDSVSKLNKAVV